MSEKWTRVMSRVRCSAGSAPFDERVPASGLSGFSGLGTKIARTPGHAKLLPGPVRPTGRIAEVNSMDWRGGLGWASCPKWTLAEPRVLPVHDPSRIEGNGGDFQVRVLIIRPSPVRDRFLLEAERLGLRVAAQSSGRSDDLRPLAR
jgi:hypothetical protein